MLDTTMRSDDAGVAGFLEDLPVLAFVLCGVMLLVSSGVWVSVALSDQREDERLRKLAERALEAIVATISPSPNTFAHPTLRSIEESNMSEFVKDLLSAVHYTVNMSAKGLAAGWSMLLRDGSSGGVSHTASAIRLLNALDDTGLVVILEVRLIVWED